MTDSSCFRYYSSSHTFEREERGGKRLNINFWGKGSEMMREEHQSHMLA